MGALVPGGVLAFDAGNSKTDVALVAADGTVLGTARGGGFEPQRIGAAAAVDSLEPLARAAAAAAGLRVGDVPLVQQISACLANADLPIEVERLTAVFEDRGWAESVYVTNDTFALLRSGVDEPRGVAVVCGAGINCSGMLPDGRTARFPALGKLTGDWGGGAQLAEEAFWSASRADDGRGPATALLTALPLHYGMASLAAVIEAFHFGELPADRQLEAAPVLFQVAAAGDVVALGIIQQQAEEIVAMASSALRRLDLLGERVTVVLGGGVLTAGHSILLDRVTKLLADVAPKAIPRVVDVPPVVGAALLGLDHTAAGASAQERLRAAFGPPPAA
ncbi:N-acetylglucosamine kinase-like BadF-type ATPase [Kribbella sp. VKM Ac-2571]|uniref:N-acetylglucosamine kinase n=1 Tax=Kribbella sp. VKM Ac-2571 TaxID=2512222 RepID=UPI00106167D2|nr:BadF/BadG/BcrA/BcrD ATPase family protein [Kribbella sp. VKM Ac-2571]TDO66591.1 N-acetylglucosamine kinase-like BadF-type ATPase [Kribbella sp. VKM Ac-2571]